MKNARILFGTVSTAALTLAVGCATAGPTPELIDARAAYDEASHGIANQYAPDDVYEAKVALENAEEAHKDDPGSQKETHYAYVAHRKSLIAMEEAKQTQLVQKKKEGEDKLAEVLMQQRDQARGQLENTEGQLMTSEEQRRQAEQRAANAMASLKEIANVKADAQRTIITLDGAVLFKTNEAELLPIARDKLQTVATALKDSGTDGQITIEGHTDSRGSDKFNRDLSQRRADSVREYLISQGVEPERVKALGQGESEPIASNDSAEGRANNRRVEIIMDNAPAGKSAQR